MSENTIEQGDEAQAAADELQDEQLGKGYGADEGERLEPLPEQGIRDEESAD